MTSAYQPPSPNTAYSFAAVTPSDSSNQPVPFRALWIGTAGTVTIVGLDGTVALFNAPQGPLPVAGIRVNATGTTASQIVALN